MVKEQTLIRSAIEQVGSVLGQIPAISDIVTREIVSSDQGADFIMHARVDGKQIRLAVEVKPDGQPRNVKNAMWGLHYYTQHNTAAYPILVAPYLSERSRGICEEARVGYLDFQGNCKIAFGSIYIERSVPTKPEVLRKATYGLFTPKGARILRALLSEPRRSWKVKDLAAQTGVSLGQVSNLRRALIDGNWILPESQGIELSDPTGLLDEWKQFYRKPRGERLSFYTPLHGESLVRAVTDVNSSSSGNVIAAAATAARWLAPYLRSSTETFYVDDDGLRSLQERLVLSPRERGGNVNVVVVSDDGVFLDSIQPSAHIRTTGIVQTYLDLAALGERGKEAAEHLRKELLPWSTLK